MLERIQTRSAPFLPTLATPWFISGEPGYSSTDDQSPVNVTWYNNYTITKGTSVLVDGAKRDRLVWAGGTLQNMDEDAGTGSLTNLYRHGHSSACRCGIYR